MKKDVNQTINSYATHGVAEQNIDNLLKELGLRRDLFDEFMRGQTVGLVGNQAIYYTWDIEKFVRNSNRL